jgi:hypothetical protein
LGGHQGFKKNEQQSLQHTAQAAIAILELVDAV